MSKINDIEGYLKDLGASKVGFADDVNCNNAIYRD